MIPVIRAVGAVISSSIPDLALRSSGQPSGSVRQRATARAVLPSVTSRATTASGGYSPPIHICEGGRLGLTQPPVFFSIVSSNYLAYAITLMQSVREHHPDGKRYVILADKDPGDLAIDSALFTLVPVEKVGIPHFEHFAFRYSVLEFNTATKPFAFRWLSRRHEAEPIIYLDPDTYLVSPLHRVLSSTADGALAVITPHLTAPLVDNKRPDVLMFLRVGAYNLGFIAMGPHRARASLIDWWAERLERSAYVDFESGLFTDQKWIDLVPGLFPDVVILRDPGYNVAYWNLPHRTVALRSDGTLLANEEPVSFVHFSGVDVRHPEIFSIYQNRFDINSIGDLRPLYLQYLTLLWRNGYGRYSSVPYAWARLNDGTPITPEMRAVFRHRFDIGCPQMEADPFGLTREAVEDRMSLVSRFSRSVLRHYPRLRAWPPSRWIINRLGPGSRWALRRYLIRTATPQRVRAARQAAGVTPNGYPTSRPTGFEGQPKANIIGYFKGEFGVAEAARLLVRAARAGGVDTALIGLSAPDTAREEDDLLADTIGDTAPHSVNVLCVNADQTAYVMGRLGPGITSGRYNVGVWFWELAKFPAAWQGAFDALDEIWVATDYVRDSIATVAMKPVRTIRLPVDATPSRPYRRAEFALPDDKFAFLFSFDFNSFTARKNPAATVAAFRLAFPAGDDRAVLKLKTTNGGRRTNELDRLQTVIDGDKRIHLSDGFMSRDEMFGLESVVDSYISLHRSEGFGLGLAESMSLGKPVIGTAYSGNMEFMDASNSCLVSYRLIDVRPDEYPHGNGQLWADPDLDHAAYFMRRLVDDRAFASDLGRRARDHMAREFSFSAIGKRIADELRRLPEGPDL